MENNELVAQGQTVIIIIFLKRLHLISLECKASLTYVLNEISSEKCQHTAFLSRLFQLRCIRNAFLLSWCSVSSVSLRMFLGSPLLHPLYPEELGSV